MTFEAAIIEILKQNPTGISTARILLLLPSKGILKSSKATLRRRLAVLTQNGKIRAEGHNKNRIYKPLPPEKPTIDFSAFEKESLEIQNYVHLPIALRKPVGYNADFLLSYIPNQTPYLSQAVCTRLHEIGRSNMEERPAGTYARDILGRLLVDLSYASSHLEGNTYSILDTRQLIEEGIAAQGKSALESQMILNHKRAIELLVEDADEIGFNSYTLLNLHAILSDGLLADSTYEGRLRTRIVEISGSVFHPLPVPQQIEEYFQIFQQKASSIKDPFEQAFFAMVHIPYLQPFEDVNKRVSRLAANIPFIRANLCPLSFRDTPTDTYVEALLGVYELNQINLLRDIFIWSYERSSMLYPLKKAEAPPPDPVKLKYHTQLRNIVRMIVLGEATSTKQSIQKEARLSNVAKPDIPRFIELVQKSIHSLHEGNFARHGIRPREFQQWKEKNQ